MTRSIQSPVAKLPIVYITDQEPTALAMAEAADRTAELLSRRWKLPVPARCELRVLTDATEFILQTAPPSLRWLVILCRPLWRQRVKRAFVLAGGWTLPWPGRPVVGVKPPELLPPPDPNLGEKLFAPVPDPLEKVKHLTCHELTHAFTAHLRLPPWLNEGVAMRAVDHMVGRRTVLESSRSLAASDPSAVSSSSYRRLGPEDHDELLKLYATGYWLTRKMDESGSSALLDLLHHRRPVREVNRIAASQLCATIR